jgi:hypothetical protein
MVLITIILLLKQKEKQSMKLRSLAEIDATEQKTGKKLDEFIKASLLPANER